MSPGNDPDPDAALIKAATQFFLGETTTAPDQLPPDVTMLWAPANHGVPLWLHLCRELRTLGATHDETGTKAMAALRCLAGDPCSCPCCRACQVVDRMLDPYGDVPKSAAARSFRVAATAANHRPADPSDAALSAWLMGEWPEAPQLTMQLLLVEPERAEGVPGLLDFWFVPPRDTVPASSRRHALVRAPAIALLATDKAFEAGFNHLAELLGQVVTEGAPTIAVGIRWETGLLGGVNGDSAAAAMTVGALWMLQDYLQPDLSGLAEALCELRPERLVVTGSLKPAPDSLPGDNVLTQWRFAPIGSYREKVRLALKMEANSSVLYFHEVQAQPATGSGVLDSTHLQAPTRTVLDDLNIIAERTGHSFNQQQRALYRRVLHELVDTISPVDWWPAMRPPEPNATLESWLLHRCAQRASESAPARAHGYSPLYLAVPLDGDSFSENLSLKHLLHGDEGPAAAWRLVGPPLSGKSSLLARWELETAVLALTQLHHAPNAKDLHAPDVEVCVFVDLRLFAAAVTQPPEAIGGAFSEHLKSLAGWLEASDGNVRAPNAGAPAYGSAGYRRHHVKLRLLLDGIEGLPAANDQARAHALAALVGWLSRLPVATLLPPVFTARDDAGRFPLTADVSGTRWQPKEAHVLPWTRTDWRAHLGTLESPGPAALNGPALQVLRKRLGLDFSPETDAGAPDDEFQAFCRVAGHLTGVCDLLRNDPEAALPTRPGRLLLALMGQRLEKDWLDQSTAGPRQNMAAADYGTLAAARAEGWSARRLLKLAHFSALARLAGAMTDASGQPRRECTVGKAPKGWKSGSGPNLTVATRLGLVTCSAGVLRFSQPQWQALFLAIARSHALAPMPKDLEPRAETWRDKSPTNSPMLERLLPRPRLNLPERSPHQQAMRLMADVADDPANCIKQLQAMNLALAAQVGIDHRHRLEAAGVPHPVLQGLRRALLGRSTEASAPMAVRMEAALLLGQLGDTLRYEPKPIRHGALSPRRLKSPHWHPVIVKGTTLYVAALLLTQGEWDDFINDLRTGGSDLGADLAWVRNQLRDAAHAPAQLHGLGLHLNHPMWANPLLPVTGVSLPAVRAYLAWARSCRLYADIDIGEPDLPTEWEWAKAAEQRGREAGSPQHVTDANHAGLGWLRPSPVGLFEPITVAAHHGKLADLRGNVRQWCGSALGRFDLANSPGSFSAERCHLPCNPSPSGMAVRGTHFGTAVERCQIDTRGFELPEAAHPDLGVRLVLRPAAGH